MKKRALFMMTVNQYNVVYEMLKKVALYLSNELGWEIYLCGTGEDYQDARLEEWDFIFSSQGAEFAFLPEADGKTHVTWICDHPRNVLPRFVNYEDKEHMYIGCVDRKHPVYLDKYYGIKNGIFMPHFGWKAEHSIPYKERSIDVFFPATYTYWEEEVAVRYDGLEGALKVITEKTMEYIIAHDDVSIEEGMEQVLRSFGEEDTVDLVRECMEFVGEYIEFYWRSYYHKLILKEVLGSGIKITVCGKNWNRVKQEWPESENLVVLSEDMPYEEVIEKIADSKMVLNIVPSFKDGGHERIAMATLNGAVCLTDESIYTRELFDAKKGVVFFDRQNPVTLVKQIKELLENPDEAEQIAMRGQKIAQENLTVKNFVEAMLQELNKN